MTTNGKRALVVAGVLVGAWLLLGYAVPFTIDLVGRGKRLTYTELDDNLSIDEDPQDLAELAGAELGRAVDVGAYAAARMVRSEEPNASDNTKRYLVHVALNDAARKGVSLLRILTLSSNSSRDGLFGKQTSRRYSTRSDPYERDLLIAEEAIAEHQRGNDPTRGAWHFYHKQLTNIFGVASFDTVVENWGKEGAYPFELPDTAIGLVFFGPDGERVS